MDYDQSLDYLLSLSDIERSRDLAKEPPRFNLERVERLLELAGRPQDRFGCVHIAGTKGKGSTAVMVDAVLRAANHHVGLFTSPHLHRFSERITIDGQPIEEQALAEITSELRPAVEAIHRRFTELGGLTTFEVTTAVALVHFARQKVDYAILEVGMGGRLDATNVVTPMVAAITSISLDHTRFLGNSLLEIAAEKAGIIKPGVPVVVAPQPAEAMGLIKETAAAKGARLIEVGRDVTWSGTAFPGGQTLSVRGRLGDYDDLRLALLGEHQGINAAVAVAVVETLREQGVVVGDDAIRRGLRSAWWPGRLETVALTPRIVVDGAHNVDSMHRLAAALKQSFSYDRLIVVLGTSLDKDISGMIAAIGPAAGVLIATRSSHPRSAETEKLAKEAAKYVDQVYEAPGVDAALSLALKLAHEKDLICATGSLFVVSEAREAMGLTSAEDKFTG